MRTDTPASPSPWSAIDAERRRDRILRRVSIAAWSGTVVVVLFIGVVVGLQVARMLQRVAAGVAEPTAVLLAALPLVVTVGVLALLIAILSTVGIFLRLRTASLQEIQLRLAAIEGIIAARPDAGNG